MEYQLDTAEDVYKAVLDGIKKESTAVLTPQSFNRLINIDALTEWMEQKSPKGDYDQNTVDAFRNLIKIRELTFSNEMRVTLPSDYYRLLSVSFKVSFSGILSNWLPAKRVRSDSYSLAVSKVNPYRSPNDTTRLYYVQQGEKIRSFPENRNIKQAKIIYYSRPTSIVFNSEGGQHKHGNLNKEQKKEIVDIAVRIFLERVKEERYQTQLVEESLKQQK